MQGIISQLNTTKQGVIAKQGGGLNSSSSRIESIERIDLTGNGNNTLKIGIKDVLDMAGMNSFNNANGDGLTVLTTSPRVAPEGWRQSSATRWLWTAMQAIQSQLATTGVRLWALLPMPVIPITSITRVCPRSC